MVSFSWTRGGDPAQAGLFDRRAFVAYRADFQKSDNLKNRWGGGAWEIQ